MGFIIDCGRKIYYRNPVFFYQIFYQNHSLFLFFSLSIFRYLDVCDSPVAVGVSLFFLRPPDILGAGVSVVFATVFLLADFFFVDFFSSSAVSSGDYSP